MSGINKLLNAYKNTSASSEIPKLLTREEVMDNMHIKDVRIFNQLINDGLPHFKAGRKVLIPLDKYIQWLEKQC